MLAAQVAPYSSQLWHWGKEQPGANLISVTQKQLYLTLLPRTQGTFCRDGLHVHKLRYRHDGYTEQYLIGGSIMVAYDPDNTSTVWTLEKGSFVPFQLIESQHAGLSFDAVNTTFSMQRQQQKNTQATSLQAQIDLGAHIDAIASNRRSSTQPDIKGIRSTRIKEQNKARHQGGNANA